MVTHGAYELRRDHRASLIREDLRRAARPVASVLAEIHKHAATRMRLYRRLSEVGADERTREDIASLSQRLDYLYEELRIARMVTP